MHPTSCSHDRDHIHTKQVAGIVRDLCVSYSLLRRSFLQRLTEIDHKLEGGDITGLIREMIHIYNLPHRFIKQVGYNAKISAPAMLQMEFVGSNQRPQSSTLYFRSAQKALTTEKRYLLLHMIAHELAHARLHLDVHTHRLSEFTTDVLALLVTGDADSFSATMQAVRVSGHSLRIEEHGYIRPELQPEVYRCLQRYVDTVYL